MDDKPIPGKNNLTRKRIIGLLGDNLHFELPLKVLNPVKELVRKNNMELYYFPAQHLLLTKTLHYQSNILYNFISRDIVDGLIIMSNFLNSYVTTEQFAEKCRQYQNLPRVSLGLELADMPSVLIDNESGMYTAVKHLIEEHHYTRIGFITGPADHPESRARFRAYKRAMQDHELPVSQTLVFEGDFQAASGSRAIKKLIKERQQLPGRDIDAIVCANDYMATGVIFELLDRGYRIPGDIAIVGFDDIIHAKCISPALSTVSNPIGKMAVKAFELLFAMMNGEQVPKTAIILTEFVQRNSCGCVNKINTDYSYFLSNNSKPPVQSLNFISLDFYKRMSLSIGRNIHIWQDVLTYLQVVDQMKKNNQENSLINDIIMKTNTLLTTTANDAFKTSAYERNVQAMGINMISTLDLPELLQILTKALPPLGIRRCYLNLYEEPAKYDGFQSVPRWSRMILAFYEKEGQIIREELPPDGLRFQTKQLIPREMTAKHGFMSWIVQALFFHDEKIGFILMDSEAYEESFYFYFKPQISSSLKGVLLLKGYQDRSRKLADAYTQIHEFNKQLKDENLRITMEMDVARGIQTAMLPRDVSHIHPDFEIASLMIPATEVGGDYFDITLDDQQHLWIGIGDVSGHGLKSGLIMLIAQSAQTAIMASYDVTPRDVIITMNKVLFRSVTNRMQQNQYMTCAMLKYLNKGRFQYAGMHLNFLIYRKKQRTCEEITLNGLWLNITRNIDYITQNSEFELDTGDVLVLYTDGITEVANTDNKLLDIGGLKQIIIRHGEKSIDEMLHAIKDEVQSWSAGVDRDDRTLVLIRRIQ